MSIEDEGSVDLLVFFYRSGDHRNLHVLTHSFPTRRSSDLCSPRPAATWRSTALWQVFNSPPANQRQKGLSESSSTRSHVRVQSISPAAAAQNPSGSFMAAA